MSRKYSIDNLRWMAILLLFPFHAAQIWSGGGDGGFYIWSHTDSVLHAFSNVVYPWFMSLLFVIAGISCKYSLQKRSAGEFIAERSKKLLIPFVFGVIALAPTMTYIAEIFFNGYKGSYINQYKLFFTKETDLTGYRGGFTPGHLWFLIYLFVISLVSILIIILQKKFFKKHRPAMRIKNIPYALIVLLFIPEWISIYFLNVGGKSLAQFLLLFLFGYYIFSNESVLEKIMRQRFISLSLCIISGTLYVWLYCFTDFESFVITGLYILYGWTGIITLLGMGRKYFDFHNSLTDYFSKSSFCVYIIHMPILVVAGFFVLKISAPVAIQFLLIVLISFAATFLIYEIVKRIPVLRFLLGVHGNKQNKAA